MGWTILVNYINFILEPKFLKNIILIRQIFKSFIEMIEKILSKNIITSKILNCILEGSRIRWNRTTRKFKQFLFYKFSTISPHWRFIFFILRFFKVLPFIRQESNTRSINNPFLIKLQNHISKRIESFCRKANVFKFKSIWITTADELGSCSERNRGIIMSPEKHRIFKIILKNPTVHSDNVTIPISRFICANNSQSSFFKIYSFYLSCKILNINLFFITENRLIIWAFQYITHYSSPSLSGSSIAFKQLTEAKSKTF